jgi:hypothetical protein
MGRGYLWDPDQAFSFSPRVVTLRGVIRSEVPHSRGRIARRTGLGLLVGALGGWIAGLLRAPRKARRP